MATILNLGTRMESIIELCDNVKTIADIGCDHGYITAELILQEKADKVISTDVSEKCLNKAILFCDSMNINGFISFREGDGFSVITKRDKVNLAVIAGMGGREIISILEKKPKKLFDFVLQPQSDVPLLREYLATNGFMFVVDKLVREDGKYYNVIKVTKRKKKIKYNPLEIYFGITNFRENYELFYEYLIERYNKLSTYKELYKALNQKSEEELQNVLTALSMYGVDPTKDNTDINNNIEKYVNNQPNNSNDLDARDNIETDKDIEDSVINNKFEDNDN